MNQEPKWIGEFSLEDREEISSLRTRQVFAIEHSDATTYRDLCTDDILLMLQGNDVIVGKSDFYKTELKLFEKVKFASIKQIPIRVERQDNLAVEVGRQELVVLRPQNLLRITKAIGNILMSCEKPMKAGVLRF